MYFFDAAVASAGEQDAEWWVYGLTVRGERERRVHRSSEAIALVLMGWADWRGGALPPTPAARPIPEAGDAGAEAVPSPAA